MADKPKNIFSRIFNSQEPQKSIDPNIEEIKDEYPDEYDVYKRLNADSVIAVPVTPRPTGFLVIRNPTR